MDDSGRLLGFGERKWKSVDAFAQERGRVRWNVSRKGNTYAQVGHGVVQRTIVIMRVGETKGDEARTKFRWSVAPLEPDGRWTQSPVTYQTEHDAKEAALDYFFSLSQPERRRAADDVAAVLDAQTADVVDEPTDTNGRRLIL